MIQIRQNITPITKLPECCSDTSLPSCWRISTHYFVQDGLFYPFRDEVSNPSFMYNPQSKSGPLTCLHQTWSAGAGLFVVRWNNGFSSFTEYQRLRVKSTPPPPFPTTMQARRPTLFFFGTPSRTFKA